MGLLDPQHDVTISMPSVSRALAIIFLGLLLRWLNQGRRVRIMFRSLRDEGIPIMKHSMILGHLEIVGKLVGSVPSDAHGDYLIVKIQENWKELFPQCTRCPPVAYVDTWPFGAPLLISLDRNVSVQCIQEHSLPKASQQGRLLYPLTKNRDLATMEGAEWKLWRKRLGPFFSIQNITSRIPHVVDEVEEFRSVLKSKAGEGGSWGKVFQFEQATVNLALDVGLRFVLNHRFHEQRGKPSPLSAALHDTISRLVFFVDIGNFLKFYNPWRHFKLWQNYRAIVNGMLPFIQDRLSRLQMDGRLSNETLVDLILQNLEKDRTSQDKPDNADNRGDSLVLDKTSLELIIGHVNTLLFAGFDTTSATICWLFHVLAQYPKVLAKVREEHDAVLGLGAWNAGDVLRENPQLLNKLTYTHAVLRESMRVHANVGSIRRGEPGFFLKGPPGSGPGFEGMKLPTDGFVVWDGTFAIHRDPNSWHRADEFLPERFLVTDTNDPLYPPPNGWRSFEAGSRNCIGQHLAVTEIKLCAALVVRCFDIEYAWDKWDESRGLKNKPNSEHETVWGDRAYQVGETSPPRMKDGMPVHIRIRNESLRSSS